MHAYNTKRGRIKSYRDIVEKYEVYNVFVDTEKGKN